MVEAALQNPSAKVDCTALRDAILATERHVDGLRTFTVLSVGEEFVFLIMPEAPSTGHALIDIDGIPFDRHETAEGAILFDISAFFGKCQSLSRSSCLISRPAKGTTGHMMNLNERDLT
jgi:hypothetical protein